MSSFHVRRRLSRLRRAPWWRLTRVSRQGFVFAEVLYGGVECFDALSWTGFYVCRGASTADRAIAHLAFNREVIRRLRAKRGRM